MQGGDIFNDVSVTKVRQRAPDGSVAIGTPVKTHFGSESIWGIVCDSFIGGEDADGQGIIFYTVRWTIPGNVDFITTSNEPEYNLVYPFGLNRKIMDHLGVSIL